MAVAYVVSNNIIEKNGVPWRWGSSSPNGLSESIPVAGTDIFGVWWQTPVLRFTNSNELIFVREAVNPAAPSTPPTIDSVKMLVLKNSLSNQEWGIAIANTDETTGASPQSAWAFRADGSGGTLPVMPSVTIPVPLIQQDPATSVTSGGVTTNTFYIAFPQNPTAALYSIVAAYFNGTAPAQAYEPAGITTLAQFVTWANTALKWPMYGTWSSPNALTLKLVSLSSSTIPVTKLGILVPALATSVRVLDMTGISATINGVGFGGGVPIPFKDGAFLAADTTNSKNAIINQIAKIYQANQVTAAISGAHNINVTTALGVCVLYNDTTAIVTSS